MSSKVLISKVEFPLQSATMNFVMEYRRIMVCKIAKIVGILMSRLHNILHKKCKWKSCVDFVATMDQKHVGKNILHLCLSMFKRNSQDFWRPFMTMDETWIHHYKLNSKQQLKQ